MESAQLSNEDVKALPDGQGVYQLLWKNQIVYIGKTDSEAGLQKRLGRHAWTIQHRQHLHVDDVSFKAIRVFVFTAMDLETQLIAHYKGAATVTWNNSGFGSNDPGRNRDFTRAKAGSFDVLYPLDLDVPFTSTLKGPIALHAALRLLRDSVPYIIRVEGNPQNKRELHPDFNGRSLDSIPSQTSARELIRSIVAVLPSGWQATALAGRLILYHEHRDDYPENKVIARS